MGVKSIVKAMLPDGAVRRLLHVQSAVKIFSAMDGVVPRECPVCCYHGMFRFFGSPPRYDAQCGKCGSLERHRLIRLALNQYPLREDSEVIHFAPEKELAAILPRKNYRSADIAPGKADLTLNIEAIDLPDACADIVIANHVLEHVDDRKALSEIRRILRPGGLLLATVPIVEGWETYEDAAITDPKDREVHFGQSDHVRYYGSDFRERVTGTGFRLQEFVATGAECARYGLLLGERVFLCYR